ERPERDAREAERRSQRQERPVHAQGACRSRKGNTAASNASGARRFTTWSASSIVITVAPEMPARRCSPSRSMSGGSWPETTTSVGAEISPSRSAAGGSSGSGALVHRELVEVVERDLADPLPGLVIGSERRPALEPKILSVP